MLRLAAPGVRLRDPRVRFLVDAPRLDVDALVKPVLDAVAESGVIANDWEIVKQGSEPAPLRAGWKGPARGAHFIRLFIEGGTR